MPKVSRGNPGSSPLPFAGPWISPPGSAYLISPMPAPDTGCPPAFAPETAPSNVRPRTKGTARSQRALPIATASAGLYARRVDVRPLLSGQYPLQDAVAAFAAAADKNRSTKVQVVFQ